MANYWEACGEEESYSFFLPSGNGKQAEVSRAGSEETGG